MKTKPRRFLKTATLTEAEARIVRRYACQGIGFTQLVRMALHEPETLARLKASIRVYNPATRTKRDYFS